MAGRPPGPTRAAPLPAERLVLNAAQVATIGKTFNELRSGVPRAQLYELIRSARNQDDGSLEKAAARIRAALSKPQEVSLDDLKASLGGADWAYWLHLVELWDYAGVARRTGHGAEGAAQ